MENIQFILCDYREDLCKEWNKCIMKLPSEYRKQFTIFQGYLDDYNGKFDCIVSPANSIARLDGSYDLVISKMLCPEHPEAVTEHCQDILHRVYNGYQVTGTCLLMPVADFGESRYGCKWIAHCPTMRTPSNCKWNKEVVYNCIWSLLCELHHHPSKNGKIKTVLLTGLGTGVGQFPADTCAAQMMLAFRHFRDNLKKSSKTTSWSQARDYGLDIEETYRTSAFLQ